MSQNLTALEQAVLKMMLTGANANLVILRQQFSKVIVSKRKLTGCGFFTDFEVPPSAPRLQKRSRITITDISGEFPKLKHGAGFVLFVDDGAMKCLEGFTYDEPWPDSPANFALSYLMESPRGSGKLLTSIERDVVFGLKDLP